MYIIVDSVAAYCDNNTGYYKQLVTIMIFMSSVADIMVYWTQCNFWHALQKTQQIDAVSLSSTVKLTDYVTGEL